MTDQEYDNAAESVMDALTEAVKGEPTWIELYAQFIGVDGMVGKVFEGKPGSAKRFMLSDYGERLIRTLNGRMRSKGETVSSGEPKVITIRIPVEMHSQLRRESKAEGMSMNKLAIVKLCTPVRE